MLQWGTAIKALKTHAHHLSGDFSKAVDGVVAACFAAAKQATSDSGGVVGAGAGAVAAVAAAGAASGTRAAMKPRICVNGKPMDFLEFRAATLTCMTAFSHGPAFSIIDQRVQPLCGTAPLDHLHAKALQDGVLATLGIDLVELNNDAVARALAGTATVADDVTIFRSGDMYCEYVSADMVHAVSAIGMAGRRCRAPSEGCVFVIGLHKVEELKQFLKVRRLAYPPDGLKASFVARVAAVLKMEDSLHQPAPIVDLLTPAMEAAAASAKRKCFPFQHTGCDHSHPVVPISSLSRSVDTSASAVGGASAMPLPDAEGAASVELSGNFTAMARHLDAPTFSHISRPCPLASFNDYWQIAGLRKARARCVWPITERGQPHH